MTIITKLSAPPLDMSQSFLYFKNQGEISAVFTVQAKGSAIFTSEDFLLIPDIPLPGLAFSIPKIVTVGPSFKMYASAEAELAMAGKVESRLKLADWNFQQTYPQENNDYNPKATSPMGGIGNNVGLLQPSFDYSIVASGSITAHIKPALSFGLVFDPYWEIGSCAVELLIDGYMRLEAEAGISSNNTCPFKYGLVAGAKVTARAKVPKPFKWKPEPYDFPVKEWDIKRSECPTRARYTIGNVSNVDTAKRLVSSEGRQLRKRGRVYGPLFSIPPLGKPEFCDKEPSACEILANDDGGGTRMMLGSVESMANETGSFPVERIFTRPQDSKAGLICSSSGVDVATQNWSPWTKLKTVSDMDSSILCRI
jgi:chitinase